MRNALLPGSEKRVRTILGNSSDPLFDMGSGKRVRTILGNSSDPLFDMTRFSIQKTGEELIAAIA
jgi:hypothetical protein